MEAELGVLGREGDLMWNYEECALRRVVVYALFMNDYDPTCPLLVDWVRLDVGDPTIQAYATSVEASRLSADKPRRVNRLLAFQTCK